MGALISLALTLAPELAQFLSGDAAEATTKAVTDAIQSVTGTSEPEAATASIQQNPSMAVPLRVKLAGIAAERARTARQADLAALAATLRADPDTSTAISRATAWAAPVVSAAVLLIFAVVMTLVLAYGIRPGGETTSNMLLGTLSAMATSVVSYWVGSSAGSARKDDRLAQINK